VFVDRFLHTAMFYFGDYNFMLRTPAEDGDSSDALNVGTSSVVPGAVVRSRAADRSRGQPGRAGARQENDHLRLELIRKMTPFLAHSTPSRSSRSLPKVSTNAGEAQGPRIFG
jgi:hypothetical protein